MVNKAWGRLEGHNTAGSQGICCLHPVDPVQNACTAVNMAAAVLHNDLLGRCMCKDVSLDEAIQV